VAFSPDGTHLVTASFDHDVRIWHSATGALRARLVGHRNEVHAVAFSPDGGRLVSGGNDAQVFLWDAREGVLLATLAGHSAPITSATFSPDGHFVLTADVMGVARLFPGSVDAVFQLGGSLLQGQPEYESVRRYYPAN
jgi:WD40 repeat protein